MRAQLHIIAVEDGVTDAEIIERHLANAGLRCVVRQVKTEREAEIELGLAQKLEPVGRLAAGIAHEINTSNQYISESADFLRSAFAEIVSAIPGAEQPPDGNPAADLRPLLAEIPRAIERIVEGSRRVAAIVRHGHVQA